MLVSVVPELLWAETSVQEVGVVPVLSGAVWEEVVDLRDQVVLYGTQTLVYRST